MFDQISTQPMFQQDDCLKLNIRASYTGSLTDELERLFVYPVQSQQTNNEFHKSRDLGTIGGIRGSVWADFTNNGVDRELDEIDQLGIRVRRGAGTPNYLTNSLTNSLTGSPALSGCCGATSGSLTDTGESMSDSCSTISSSSDMDAFSLTTPAQHTAHHNMNQHQQNSIAAPMSRTRLLEILRMSERGRLKSKAASQKVAAAKQTQPTNNPTQVCVFCRNNGESEAVYSSHTLKDSFGKTACPVLYIYTCPICGANGPDAHTIKYCPQNNHSGVQPTAPSHSAHSLLHSSSAPATTSTSACPSSLCLVQPVCEAQKPRTTFSRHQRRQQRYQQQQQKHLQQMYSATNWGM